MKWLVWIIAILIVAASVPLAMSAKKSVRKGNAAGATMVIGLAFATVFDPKSAAAVELIQTRKEQREDDGGGQGADPEEA